MSQKSITIFFIAFFASFTMLAQRSYIRSKVRQDVENKIKDNYEDDRQKGVKAVDESLDRMDAKDAEFRAGVKPFPTLSYKITIEYPTKPKNNGVIKYYFKNYDCAADMSEMNTKSGEMRVITNFKKGKSITLMTDKKGKKTGMEMDMKMLTSMAQNSANRERDQSDYSTYKLEETNEYKTINGYKCRKYIMNQDRYTIEIWVTNDKMPAGGKDFSFAMANAFGGKNTMNTSYYANIKGGVCIQTHMIPKDSKSEEMIMTYSDFSSNVSESVFSTEGYEIQSMPSMRDLWNTARDER